MSSLGRRANSDDTDALQMGPRKRAAVTDPLVHRGRHFGRVAYAFCNVKTLITNGLVRMADDDAEPAETISARREEELFNELLKLTPGLKDTLLDASEERIGLMADLIQRGINGACSDDTKTMKTAIIDWIAPSGQMIEPPLNCKIKTTRGFHHERTGALLCPAGLDWAVPQNKEKLCSGEMLVRGDQWPLFLYADLAYDPEDPWNGLLCNQLLVSGYKHVFTSPSSVDDEEPRATRSGNACIHGMTSVTKVSLAYIATQVCFALCSSSIFSRTDVVTNSETFYTSILSLLDNPEEKEEVNALFHWWNRKIFPHAVAEARVPVEGSALSHIKQKRRENLNARHID